MTTIEKYYLDSLEKGACVIFEGKPYYGPHSIDIENRSVRINGHGLAFGVLDPSIKISIHPHRVVAEKADGPSLRELLLKSLELCPYSEEFNTYGFGVLNGQLMYVPGHGTFQQNCEYRRAWVSHKQNLVPIGDTFFYPTIAEKVEASWAETAYIEIDADRVHEGFYYKTGEILDCEKLGISYIGRHPFMSETPIRVDSDGGEIDSRNGLVTIYGDCEENDRRFPMFPTYENRGTGGNSKLACFNQR